MEKENYAILAVGGVLAIGALAYVYYNSNKGNGGANLTGQYGSYSNPSNNSQATALAQSIVASSQRMQGNNIGPGSGGQDTTNLILFSGNANTPTGSSVSANQIQASPNVVVGALPADYANTNTAVPVFSANSDWNGPGEYITKSGGPSYIPDLSTFQQQRSLGFL